jgi:hypothetical protein
MAEVLTGEEREALVLLWRNRFDPDGDTLMATQLQRLRLADLQGGTLIISSFGLSVFAELDYC